MARSSPASRRKQHRFMHSAPLHMRQKMVGSHLSKELRSKIGGVRAIQLHKGDKVKVMRGEHKGTVAKVEEIDLVRTRAYLEGITQTKVNGAKVKAPIHPSNLLILELGSEDKFRKRSFEKGGKKK